MAEHDVEADYSYKLIVSQLSVSLLIWRIHMKKPFVTLEQLKEITKKYPTPFHIYDEKGIRENARKLNKAFAWNKGFREYFAVKATPNPYIINILKEEGCGVDCSSLTELMMSEALGFSGNGIMFSSNATPPEEFIKARKLNAIINLDDFTHIDFLEKTAGIPETICCRYNPGGVFVTTNGIMDNPGDAKYGFTKEQIIEGFIKLKEKGAKNFGIHSFLASNTATNEYYPTLAGILFKLAVELRDKTGADIKFINLSGGVGIPYKPDAKENDIMEIGEGVRKAFEEILVPAGMGDVAIFTELGRFMLAPYGHLVATAIHEKHIYKEYIGLDACAVNLMRPAMYGAYHHITVMGKEDKPCDHKYDVTGSLCENNDKFAIDRMLPKIDIGDLIVIHDTGAHGFSMGYNYNGKLRSAELLLKEDGSVQMIRRAETPADYFATFDFSDVLKSIN
jgi:diaminopimelate decarboxylase